MAPTERVRHGPDELVARHLPDSLGDPPAVAEGVRDLPVALTPERIVQRLAHLRADPRVALVIDDQLHPYRKVTVEGVAELVHDTGEDDAWRDLYRRIACRYVPAEGAERYIQETIDQPRALLRVPLAGSKVRTWRMPVPGEAFTGIWHRRYYVPGSKMAGAADEA